MLFLSDHLKIPESEIECKAVRSQGAGGQNVNKVSSAIHLRFDVKASSLPDYIKRRVLALNDQRLTTYGVIVIKAQSFRTQEQNRREAMERLTQLIKPCLRAPRRRVPTKPSKNSVKKRLDSKQRKGARKELRGRVTNHD